METRVFRNQAAQGDLLIRRIDTLPPGLTLMETKPENGLIVVAHSETGHHHAIATQLGIRHMRSADPMIAYLAVEEGCTALLEHHRSFDTHAPISIGAGFYELRRQREHTPDGWRRVED